MPDVWPELHAASTNGSNNAINHFFISLSKSGCKNFKKEKTSSADGDRFGDNQYGQSSCTSSDDTVCTQYCESVGGAFDSNDRKCYIEGVAYTGGYFSGGKNRSKLQR